MTPLKPNNVTRHNLLDNADEYYMKLALKLARLSEKRGEVPIGALIVDKNGEILAKTTNKREQLTSVLGHAELLALHRACKKKKSWRLVDCTLYVTLEPCFMCAGALVQSRISRVVYGAKDPKGGALGSLACLNDHLGLNHRFEVTSGVCEQEASFLLKDFFKKKRAK